MAKGLSLNIGLNELKKGFYESRGALPSPENDARAMAALALMEGYNAPMLLLTQNATKHNLIEHLNFCAKELEAGDTFLLSYSGHGGQVMDTNGDETDGKDETWCLFDEHLIDDELYEHWKAFKKGVKIIIVSSSCHSRTAIKDLDEFILGKNSGDAIACKSAYELTTKKNIVSKHEFDPLINADIIHLSACGDKQFASAGKHFTHFTDLLLKHWDYGRFKGSYEELVSKIQKESGYCQKPGIRTLGANTPYLHTRIPFKLN
ncbi:MAG: caspase family protein [Bacteroidia bacterium]|nr:caspase family protein [Bacteroidia bacterium]